MIEIINIIKRDIQNNSNTDNKIIFFRYYFEYINVFNEINTKNLSKQKSHDHVINTILNCDFFFEFIYNFSQVKLNIFRKYIDINFKKN